MSAFVIQCPHCGKGLKLRDRSKFGQKVKCPGCTRAFLLQAQPEEEEEIPLELVDETPAATSSAQWVPDNPPALPAAQTATAVRTQTAPAPSSEGSAAFDNPVQRLKEARLRAAKRRNKAILIGGVSALVIGGLAWGLSGNKENPAAPLATGAPAPAAAPMGPQVALATGGQPPGPAVADAPTPSVVLPAVSRGATPDAVVLPHQQLTRSQLKDNDQIASTIAPRTGDPIRLYMVPSGMNVVIHMRPAKLWSDEAAWQELRYSLTEDVTNWLAARLKEVCRRDPRQIEECLICVRLGATGTEPVLSAVVHFSEENKLSSLIEEFSGEPFAEETRLNLTSAPPWAYLIKDTKTVAIVPEVDKLELPQVINTPNYNPTEGIYRLLDHTDRNRVFTILFEVDDVKRHEKWFFSERTLPIFQRILNWFGDDVETVAWSIDLREDSAVSEILLRNRSVANSGRLARDMLLELEYLPQNLQAACRKMRPTTKGFQAMIGRFPAMMEAYRQATVPSVESRHVKLTTVLPRKAAPNLALGTLLAWDLSTQTDFSIVSTTSTIASTPASDLPARVEDRLKQISLEGEFNNPFQDAVAYIAAETKTQIEIEGNALKDAGFTKNMPQKFSLGKVTGLEALRQIILFNKPPVPEKQLCLVIDEAAQTVLITTIFFAEAAGQTIYPLPLE